MTVVVSRVNRACVLAKTNRPVQFALDLTNFNKVFLASHLVKKVLLLEQDDNVLCNLDLPSIVDEVRVDAPNQQLSLALIRVRDQYLYHSDALET